MQNLQEELQKAKIERQLKLDLRAKVNLDDSSPTEPPSHTHDPPQNGSILMRQMTKPTTCVESTTEEIGENTSAIQDKYAIYKIMLKINQPVGAIRQKMKMDGFSNDEQESFFQSQTHYPGQSYATPSTLAAKLSVVKQESKRSAFSSAKDEATLNIQQDTPSKIIDMCLVELLQAKMSLENLSSQTLTIPDRKNTSFYIDKDVSRLTAVMELNKAAMTNMSSSEKLKKFEEIKSQADSAIRKHMLEEGVSDDQIKAFFIDSIANAGTSLEKTHEWNQITHVSSATNIVELRNNLGNNNDQISIKVFRASRESEISVATTRSNSTITATSIIEAIPAPRSPANNSPTRSPVSTSLNSSLRSSPATAQPLRPTSVDCTKFNSKTRLELEIEELERQQKLTAISKKKKQKFIEEERAQKLHEIQKINHLLALGTTYVSNSKLIVCNSRGSSIASKSKELRAELAFMEQQQHAQLN